MLIVPGGGGQGRGGFSRVPSVEDTAPCVDPIHSRVPIFNLIRNIEVFGSRVRTKMFLLYTYTRTQ